MLKKMCGVHKVASCLLVIGGLNWLLVGLLGKDLFVLLGLGMGHIVAKIVYVLVGVSAVSMFGLVKCCYKGGCNCDGKDCANCSECAVEKKPVAPAMPPKA